MEWILASASPRREELFKQLIPQFEIVPACGEEETEDVSTPWELAETLACQKAEEVASLPSSHGKAVRGADTVVALVDERFGKPKDEADAYRMLKALSGKTHQVYTGVCLLFPVGNGRLIKRSATACTQVVFQPLTDGQIRDYIATGSPMDKAGAYGIQDGVLVYEIQGSFSNVVGLPVELCAELLAQWEKERK